MATLHVHIDESGNFEFSCKGSRYYVFTAAWTYDPAPLAAALINLRFDLVKKGHGDELSSFHACYDPEPRRNLVIDTMLAHEGWSFASIVVDKPRVNPSLYEADKFYPKFASMVLRFIFKGRVKPRTSQVLIYTDTLPFDRKRAKAVEVAIKKSCRDDLGSGTPFKVLPHRRESNAWIQVADYCSWSVCRKWEHSNSNTDAYDRLKPKIAATEISPMSRGDGMTYY
jgi:hypothetical protein